MSVLFSILGGLGLGTLGALVDKERVGERRGRIPL